MPRPIPDGIAEELLSQRAWIHALARQLVGADEGEDLVQDVWGVALAAPPERRGGVRPWVRGVLGNLARGLRRSRARRGEREQRAARPETLPSTLELVERVDTEQRLARALLALDEPYRTTLLLRFHEGLSAAEIARRQCVPEGTVRWRSKKGLDELRERLERDFGGRDVRGFALAGLIHGSRQATPILAPGAGAAAAAGAAAMIGSKGLATGAIAIGAALAAWLVIDRRGSEPASVLGGGGDERLALERPAPLGESGVVPRLEVPDPSSVQESTREAFPEVGITRLRVLEADGRPNPGLSVVIAPKPGGEQVISGSVDAEGWVEFPAWVKSDAWADWFPASGERRQVAIERSSAFPYRTEIEFVPGPVTITLPEPEGAVLAGRVVVDGGPPRRPLWLFVYASDSANRTMDSDHRRYLLTVDAAYGETDSNGYFCFRGIPPGQGLNLRAPDGHARPGTKHHATESPVFHVFPRNDLLVELERQPSVYGRVLEADGTTPVANAVVDAEISGGRYGRSTDETGYFEMFMQRPPSDIVVRYARGGPVAWHFDDPQSEPGVSVARHFDQPVDDIDLGDLLLPTAPAPSVTLEVRDPRGSPIVGVESNVAGPTDESGRSLAEGLGPGKHVYFAKRGWRAGEIVVPDPCPPTLKITLDPTNDLTIEVSGSGNDPGSGMQLELSSSEWFLRRDWFSRDRLGDPIGWQESREWLGFTRRGGHEGSCGSTWSTRVYVRTNRLGRFTTGDLRTDLSLHVTVLDDAGASLCEKEIAPLGPTEHRVERIRVDVPTACLSGRVVSEHGAPITGAAVRLGLAGSEATNSAETGYDGRFQYAQVADRDLRLEVTKRGYAPLVLDPVRVSSQELELVLLRGMDVTVRVLDPAHGAIETSTASFATDAARGGMSSAFSWKNDTVTVRAKRRGDAKWIEAEQITDDAYELAGLSAEPHDIQALLPAGTLGAAWVPGEEEVVLYAPDRVGTVDLVWELSPDPQAAGYHVRLEPAGGGPSTERHNDFAGSMRFPQFAGDYQLVIVAERPLPGGGGRWNDDIRSLPVQIEANETTRVETGP